MDILELDKPATQSGFAELVGIGRPAVVKHIQKGTLVKGASFRQWLHAYCSRLGEGAAGRGGSQQQQLTEARTREALAKAEGQELANLQRLGTVILVEDLAPLLDNFMESLKASVTNEVDKANEKIESKYEITLDDDDLAAPVRRALASAAGVAAELGQSIRDSVEGLDSEGAAKDG